MPEFIVTLRSGARYTVRAERFRFEAGYLAFTVAPPAQIGDIDPFVGVVGLFDRSQVVSVVAREHLVSEERADSYLNAHYVTDGRDSDIPF